jgi:group I intron endonuclease
MATMSSNEEKEIDLKVNIYCITCISTGEQYVGQTKKKITYRLAEHIRKALQNEKSCTKLARAIRKYRPDNFTIELIVSVPAEEKDQAEIYWIAELNTISPYGLNLLSGGQKNSYPCEETLCRMRQSALARCTPEWRKQVSERQIGVPKSKEACEKLGLRMVELWKDPEWHANQVAKRKGKKASEETLAKMSIVQSERKREKKPRKNEDDTDLPKYVIHTREKKRNGEIREGYRVSEHPSLPKRRFGSSKMTMPEKLQAVIDYLNSADV